MQNCMEQSPSSLSVQFREQKDEYPTLVLVQNILRPIWRWFLCLALLSQLWGVLLLPRRSCSGSWGIPGRAGTVTAPSPGSRCAQQQRQNPKIPLLGSFPALISTFHQLLLKKKSIFRFKHLFLSSVKFSQHKTLISTSVNKREQSRSGAGKEPGSTSGSKAAERSLQ